jgi:hypothetical protein
MILTKLGVLSKAQDLSSETAISSNVILQEALDWGSITDVWWVVDTETIATGDGSDTYAFQLVLSAAAALTNAVQIASRTVTGYQAWSLAVAGRRILALNVGKMINEILGTGLSDYPYLGMSSTISATSTLSINAALSPYEPITIPHAQAVDSNVGVPTHASAGS